ncbi:MAG: lipid-A-disaccharide synthase [Pseudomonadota bacterium]
MNNKIFKIYIIAGEASGDFIGSKLINAINEINKDSTDNIIFKGIGGEKMQTAGITSLFPMHDISLIGFAEVIPHIFKIKKHINNTLKDIIDFQPDILITIDSPGFCVEIAKRLKYNPKFNPKVKNLKFIHYVAPTVWAYKAGRAKKFAKLFDYLLVLLPFEPPYFEKHNLKTYFVGHPIIEKQQITVKKSDFRKKHNIAEDEILISMLPGSRKSEIKRLMPIFLKAIEIFAAKTNVKYTIFIPTLTNLKTLLKQELSGLTSNYIISTDNADKYNAFAASNFALCKAGTSSLELAIAQLPMIVGYKVNYITYLIIKAMIKIKYVIGQ